MPLTSRSLRARCLGTACAFVFSSSVLFAQSSASQAARPAPPPPPPHVTPPPPEHPVHTEPVHTDPHRVSPPEPGHNEPVHAEPAAGEPVAGGPSESHPSEPSQPAEHTTSAVNSGTYHSAHHSSSSLSSSSSGSTVSRIPETSSRGMSYTHVVSPNGTVIHSSARATLPPYRLNDLNTARQKMPGLNQHPLPQGNLVQLPNGNYMLTADGHRRYNLTADGKLRSFNSPDASFALRNDGSISHLRSPSLDFSRAPNGNRKVTWRPGPDTRIVSFGPHRGFVEHTVHQNGKAYVQRISINRNKTSTRTFVRYHAKGVTLTYYPPRSFFPPGFYGWNYQPWAAGVSWSWPWRNALWYRNYGAFFFFANLYTGPAPWLADFILGETADEDAPDSTQPQDALTPDAPTYSSYLGPANSTAEPDALESQADAPITEPAKAALVGEVRTDIQQNGDIAADPTRAAEVLDIFNNLIPGYVLVVDDPLYANVFIAGSRNLTDGASGASDVCLLSPGDLITVTRRPVGLRGSFPTSAVTPPPSSPISTISTPVELEVTASRKHDCPVLTKIRISIDRLQDMDNNFRARLDDGMAVLYDTNGKKGIPAAPADATALLPIPNGALPAPVSDTTALQQLNQAQTEANRIQQQIETTAMATDVADSTAPAAAAAPSTK